MDFRDENKPRTVFRTERFCQINGSWYFVTREQTEEGPFPSRDDAQLAVLDYVNSSSAKSPPRST